MIFEILALVSKITVSYIIACFFKRTAYFLLFSHMMHALQT